MVEPQQALLAVVILNVVLVGLTVGVFWAGVFVARGFGRKADYSLAPLGFSRPRGGSLKGIRLGVAVGVGAVLVSMPVNWASRFVLDRLGYSTESTVQAPFIRGLFRWVQENPNTAIPAIILVVVILGHVRPRRVRLVTFLRAAAPRAGSAAGAPDPGCGPVRALRAHREPPALVRGPRDVQLLHHLARHPGWARRLQDAARLSTLRPYGLRLSARSG